MIGSLRYLKNPQEPNRTSPKSKNFGGPLHASLPASPHILLSGLGIVQCRTAHEKNNIEPNPAARTGAEARGISSAEQIYRQLDSARQTLNRERLDRVGSTILVRGFALPKFRHPYDVDNKDQEEEGKKKKEKTQTPEDKH